MAKIEEEGYLFISYRSIEADFALKLAGDLLHAGAPATAENIFLYWPD